MTPIAPWDRYINAPLVHELHQKSIQRYGGDPGILDEACVSGAIGNSVQSCLYACESDGDFDPLIFAAYLLFKFVTKHCFVDGNKRVGWSVCVHVLAENQLYIDATDDDAYGFVIDIAKGEIRTVEEVTHWLSSRLSPILEDDDNILPPQQEMTLN